MRKWVRKIICQIRNIFLILLSFSLLIVILYKYLPVHYTGYMLAKNVRQLTAGQKMQIDHKWVSLEKISPDLVQAVIVSEDNWFLIHNGFDFNANRGTISQETACNVFLLPGNNYLKKLLEAYYTMLIEFVWGKKRIMEVYLNSVEMENAVFGMEAIAQKNFAKPASELTLPEAALIAAALVNLSESNLSQPTIHLLRRQAKIMGLMEDRMEIQW